MSWFLKSPTQCCIFIFVLPLLLCWLLFWTCQLHAFLSLPRPPCTRLSTYSHPYSVHLFNGRISQHFHSFMVNSETLFLCLFFHLPMNWTLSRKECRDTSNAKLDIKPLLLFLLLSSVQGLVTRGICFNLFLFALGQYPLMLKKKNEVNSYMFLLKDF